MSDSLKERIEKLRATTASERATRDKQARYSRVARMHADLLTAGRFTAQVIQGLMWLWHWGFPPAWRLFRRCSRFVWRQYAALWSLAVHRRMPDGVLLFSKTRAGLMIAGTALFAWFMLLPCVHCVFDGIEYAATARVNERLYLLGSYPIELTNGTHAVEGCAALPCSDQDSVFFVTENNLFNNLWSLAHCSSLVKLITARCLFFPEYVGAAVPNVTSLCVTTNYGFRRRLPFNLMNNYAQMLSVSCRPIRGDGA